MMSTAFSSPIHGQSHGEFSASTYVLSQGATRESELVNSMEEIDSSDPVEQYFACITSCSLDDGECITVCTEQLRESH